MTPGDDIQVLFRETADLSPADRERYFAERQIPEDVRAELESLLRFDAAQEQSLTGAISAVAAEWARSAAVPAEQRLYGPYRLTASLGEGGMGAVYLAERVDGEVEQRVAIKLVRDVLRDPSSRARFLAERRILASLHHPGIARLLDAGHTEDGQPYLVMEYVDGTPIDDYCRKLPWRDTLGVFVRVCEAVSHAHGNLVVHRDLKPSNILVQADGAPKLLDFGIARMLDEAADPGASRERLLTPDYASPEQLQGVARTTATDIYSLGAVLYCLLTGHSPHCGGNGEGSPMPPSRNNPELPRDLDFVVARAMRREPGERYPTADALAEDLRALLEMRPVRARSGSAWYRARTFARRRWLPLCAVGAALAGLSGGLYFAEREAEVARHRFEQLRQHAAGLLRLDEDILKVPGSTEARKQVVSAAMQYLEGLRREAGNDPKLAFDLATGYVRMAQVQGVPAYPNLGQLPAADESLRKAQDLLDSLLRKEPHRRDALLLAAEAAQDRMMVADTTEQTEAALVQAHLCTARMDSVLSGKGVTSEDRQTAARFYINVGQGYMNARNFGEAAVEARRGVELARAEKMSEVAAVGMSLIANALRQAGDLDGALRSISEARALMETTAAPTDPRIVGLLYAILWRQGLILDDEESISFGRPEEAIAPLRQAFDLVDRIAGIDPADATARDRAGTAGRALGDALRHRDPRQALAVYDHAILRQREVKNSVRARREEAILLAHSSDVLHTLGEDGEAAARIGKAFALLRSTHDYPAPDAFPGAELERVMRASAEFDAQTGHAERALAVYRDLLRKILAGRLQASKDLGTAYTLSRVWQAMEGLERRAGRRMEAEQLSAQRLELWRGWDARLPGNGFVRRQLAAQ